jgi:DNA-binding response OmpR family regulator
MPAKMELPGKARVLVFGSDSTLERHMVAPLPSESCEIILAADSREALDLIHTGHVDVLVLDFDSHSREFPQFASTSSFAERHCPTLVLADSLEELILASETGVDGVLMKPLDPDQGRALIDNLLAGASMQPVAERWAPDTAFSSEA